MRWIGIPAPVLLAPVLLAFAAASLAPARIAGRYGHHFRNGLVDGSRYWSDDVLEIVALDPRRAYFRARINFYNGHVCSISGIAHAEPEGLVFRDRDDPAGESCLLRITAAGRAVRLDDAGTCRAYCGARGSLNGVRFDLGSRRPLPYLARLKASPEFRQAIAEERMEK